MKIIQPEVIQELDTNSLQYQTLINEWVERHMDKTLAA